MEALFLLIALTAVVGVLLVPALRRGRLGRSGGVGALTRGAAAAPAYVLTPVDELDVRLPGPDQRLVDALEEAQTEQDWQQIAQLFALTGDEWELRWQRVQSVAGAAAMELERARETAARPGRESGRDTGREAGGAEAATGPSLSKSSGKDGQPPAADGGAVRGDARWLRQWRAERPTDVGAAQVYAQFLVWQALSRPDSDEYRIILEEARTVCRDAAENSPADPTPYLTELLIARGLGYRPPDFEALWSEVTRRAPHHMGAHLAALSYLSAGGDDSKQRADTFARTAAAHAPEGTLLAALPLFAVHAHLPEITLVRSLYQSEEIEQAIEAAEFAVDQVEDDHPVRPHVLHLLVWFLVRAERYGEAMDALGAVDGYVGALPWAHSADPAAEYAAYRALAIAGWESSGSPRLTQPPER